MHIRVRCFELAKKASRPNFGSSVLSGDDFLFPRGCPGSDLRTTLPSASAHAREKARSLALTDELDGGIQGGERLLRVWQYGHVGCGSELGLDIDNACKCKRCAVSCWTEEVRGAI